MGQLLRACLVFGCALLAGCRGGGSSTSADLSRARIYESPEAQEELGNAFYPFRPGESVVDASEPMMFWLFDPEAISVPSLISELGGHGQPTWRRAKAARVLGYTRCAEAFEPLVAAASDEELEVRLAAVRALGDIGDKRAVPTLIAALREQKPEVNSDGDYALDFGEGAFPWRDEFRVQRRSGFDKAIGYLLAARISNMQTPFGRTPAQLAAQALGKIGDPSALPGLLKLLGEPPFGANAPAAAEALAKIGDASALPALEKAELVEEAAEHTTKPYPPHVPEGRWVHRAVLQLKNKARPQSELIADLASDDRYARYYAAERLSEMGDAACIPPLVALSKDAAEIRRDPGVPTVIETVGAAVQRAVETIRLRTGPGG